MTEKFISGANTDGLYKIRKEVFMMKKNIWATICAFALMLALVAPGYAAYVEGDYVAMSVEEMAYCDLETTPAALHDEIIAARKEIIYNQSWTVDGQCVLIAPDGTVEKLPEFYDLFPADWEVPTSSPDAEEIVPYANEIFFSGRIFLPLPRDVMTTPFYSFIGNGSTVRMSLSDLPGATCNMGFTNLTSNKDVGHVEDKPAGYTLMIRASSNITYGARASTHSITGYARARVEG